MLFEGKLYQELRLSVTAETDGSGRVVAIPKRVPVSRPGWLAADGRRLPLFRGEGIVLGPHELPSPGDSA